MSVPNLLATHWVAVQTNNISIPRVTSVAHPLIKLFTFIDQKK